MSGLNLCRGPGVRSAQACTGDLLEVVVADAAGSMQPKNQGILLSLVVVRRDEETVRHGLVDTRDKAVDRFLGGQESEDYKQQHSRQSICVRRQHFEIGREGK